MIERRAIVSLLVAVPLFACGGPISPPALAMRFEITREARDAIGPVLQAHAARERFKFETINVGVDRSFFLERGDIRIEIVAGDWNDVAMYSHEWPYEYQVHFYPVAPSVELDALASEIGAELAAIPGVRKSGPNFVPDKIVPETAP